MRKTKIFLKAAIVISVVLALILPSSAMITNTNTMIIEKNTKALNTEIFKQTGLAGNVLISANEGDDFHPRITTNAQGTIVVVYEQEIDMFSKQVPVLYSADLGQTWTMQFLFDSIDFTDGSGVLQYPYIVYSNVIDQFYLAMIDPFAEMYNNEMAFIQGDIANAQEAPWYGISGQESSNYNFCAAATTGNFFLSLTTEDDYGIEQAFGLGYVTYPEFESPPVMGGFYYDGQSQHTSAPAAEVEMATNSNLVMIVCETKISESVTKVTFKWNVNDEALMTNGEQENGMDKYADIEQYPGMYVAEGTDPDVSGSGNKIVVVYVQGGDVKCSYATCLKEHDQTISWQTSTVATGASTPAVYMSGDSVLCAYVKDGNLYLKVSSDAGATWGEPQKLNEVDGKVVSEKGSVDVSSSGVVFTDNRDGNKDVYFASALSAPDTPTITGSSSGKPNKEYTFKVKTTNSDGGNVWYWVDWGDGSNTGWLGPFASGSEQSVKHTWTSKAEFTIKAKAKNANGLESGWAELPFSTPKTMSKYGSLFYNFLARFPFLQHIFGL